VHILTDDPEHMEAMDLKKDYLPPIEGSKEKKTYEKTGETREDKSDSSYQKPTFQENGPQSDSDSENYDKPNFSSFIESQSGYEHADKIYSENP
jgi:hypothetical protein